jgi:ferric-dicitrate binding protein FerR (iron transport regulator)
MDGLLRELPVAAADDEALVTAVMARLPHRRSLWRLPPASNGMRFAAAAALILAVAGLALLFRPTETPIDQRIVTAEKSEELRFGDGAVRVTVYPGSDVLAAKRETGGWVLDLSQGEVFVNVVRKGTAFAVRTTAGEARALGTKYTVSLRQDKGGQKMNGLKSAVGTVMMVTVMAGTVEVLAQDQPTKVVGAGGTVSVQAPKTDLTLTALSLDDLKKLLAEKQTALTAAYKAVEGPDVQKLRAEMDAAEKAYKAVLARTEGQANNPELEAATKANNAAHQAFNALKQEKFAAAGLPKLQEEFVALKRELQRRQPPVARPQGQGGQ